MQYVYLILADRFSKIGIANDVKSRVAQLQTGNPYRLELLSCYGFEDANSVEHALHQAYSKERGIGEWFALTAGQVKDFETICSMLGGKKVIFDGFDGSVSIEDVEEAEEMQEATTNGGAKFDYAAMFADGWKMAMTDGRCKYWSWRKRLGGRDETIYGGTLESLPHPIEQMRRIYRDGFPTEEK